MSRRTSPGCAGRKEPVSNHNKITVTPVLGQDLIGFETDIYGQVAHQVASLQDQIVREQLIAAGWTPPPQRPPWIKPGDFFGGGRPAQAMDVDPGDFYGITEAIHHALEMLQGHPDAGTDSSPLDPKRSRRLRQALMAAWLLEYPEEANAAGAQKKEDQAP